MTIFVGRRVGSIKVLKADRVSAGELHGVHLRVPATIDRSGEGGFLLLLLPNVDQSRKTDDKTRRAGALRCRVKEAPAQEDIPEGLLQKHTHASTRTHTNTSAQAYPRACLRDDGAVLASPRLPLWIRQAYELVVDSLNQRHLQKKRLQTRHAGENARQTGETVHAGITNNVYSSMK